jgi:gamma-glutamyltranspeptidase/glutathione hydrolase
LSALLALNIVRGFDLRQLSFGSVDYLHTLIEAMKLGFADAFAYIGDPRHAQIPLEGLLSENYTDLRRSLISPSLAGTPSAGQPPRHGDTVYLTVADGDGNMVSWIQSLYMGFGSGLTAGTTGIQLQNRGANFVLEEGHPNQVAPGKRPYNTIIPGFITRHGQAWSSYGVMGGFMQPQGHLQVGVNLVDFDMNPQAAMDAPRFRWIRDKHVALEPAIPDDVYAGLARRGHELMDRAPAAHYSYGGGQVIVRDSNGTLIGGSDPRKDGAAVGW